MKFPTKRLHFPKIYFLNLSAVNTRRNSKWKITQGPSAQQLFPNGEHIGKLYRVSSACSTTWDEIPMIQRVPTARYFIIRPHIGVKWSFDVYNMKEKGRRPTWSARGARVTTPRGNVICDLGGLGSPGCVCQVQRIAVCQTQRATVAAATYIYVRHLFFKYLFCPLMCSCVVSLLTLVRVYTFISLSCVYYVYPCRCTGMVFVYYCLAHLFVSAFER